MPEPENALHFQILVKGSDHQFFTPILTPFLGPKWL
jgi:hypothetical protein